MTAIIIGAGASGLACAIRLKQKIREADITVLERLDSPGRKILATGNGRCNITNTTAANYKFTSAFFANIGLVLRELEEGRVYPYSLKAETVLAVLLEQCEKLGIKIITSCKVQEIKKNGANFILRTKKGNFSSDIVVAATGGKAQSALGSDGSGYALMRSLGHTVTPLCPALVQLTSSSKYPRAVKGTRTRCGITIEIDGEKAAQEYGEVLFTDYGLSGIAVMNVSSSVSAAFENGKKPKCLAVLDLVPEMSEGRLLSHIKKFGSLRGILGSKLSAIIEKQANGDKAAQAHTAKNWRLIITGTKGYDHAQITCGGVPVNEVDNFASKKAKGLYICGELLNKQFPCGGFNLDFAWGSGIAAADEIVKEYGTYDKNQ